MTRCGVVLFPQRYGISIVWFVAKTSIFDQSDFEYLVLWDFSVHVLTPLDLSATLVSNPGCLYETLRSPVVLIRFHI